MKKLKNWWVAVTGAVLLILDLGFDVVNPVLEDAGLSENWLRIIKVAFGLYGIYKLYKVTPFKANFTDGDGAGTPDKGL